MIWRRKKIARTHSCASSARLLRVYKTNNKTFLYAFAWKTVGNVEISFSVPSHGFHYEFFLIFIHDKKRSWTDAKHTFCRKTIQSAQVIRMDGSKNRPKSERKSTFLTASYSKLVGSIRIISYCRAPVKNAYTAAHSICE